jgi:hypothetical protein
MASPMPEISEQGWHVGMLVDEDGNGPIALGEPFENVVCAACGGTWVCDAADPVERHPLDVIRDATEFLLQGKPHGAQALIMLEPLSIARMADLVVASTLFTGRLMRSVAGQDEKFAQGDGFAALQVARVDTDTGEIVETDIDEAPAAVRYGGRMVTAAVNDDKQTVYALVTAAVDEVVAGEAAGNEDAIDLLIDLLMMTFTTITEIGDDVREAWAQQQRSAESE